MNKFKIKFTTAAQTVEKDFTKPDLKNKILEAVKLYNEKSSYSNVRKHIVYDSVNITKETISLDLILYTDDLDMITLKPLRILSDELFKIEELKKQAHPKRFLMAEEIVKIDDNPEEETDDKELIKQLIDLFLDKSQNTNNTAKKRKIIKILKEQ